MESQKSSIRQIKAEELSAKSEVSDDVVAVLRSIRAELQIIKTANVEMLKYMRDAESEIPESYRRFLNAFHDMHDIKYMNEEHGVDPPEYVLRAIERFYDRLRQIEEKGKKEGEHINKILREMSGDKANRYDHTKQLPKPQGKESHSK